MKKAATLFSLTVLTRLAAIGYLIHVHPQYLTWGINEAGWIARSIVLNHSYSSPFHDATGPTAWLGPVYPTFLAALFKIFGIQTAGAMLAAMIFNSIFAGLTAIMLYQIAKDLVIERAGFFAGILWAACPYCIILVVIPWETSFAALMFTVAFRYTLRIDADIRDWLLSGASWGILGLINPALAIPLPFLLGWRLQENKRWRSAIILTSTAALIVSPWIVRDYVAFHRFIPIRSNGAAEIYFANVSYSEHPLGNSMEYQNLGEVEFTSVMQSKAIGYLKSHARLVLANSFMRAAQFWSSPDAFLPIVLSIHLAALLGLVFLFRFSNRIGWMFAIVLAVFPLLYYASLPFSRYRHPIDPLLFILAGIASSSHARRTLRTISETRT